MFVKILFLTFSILNIACANSGHHPQEFLKSIAGKKNEGHLIAEHFCLNCHAPDPLISIGAPTKGNKEAWKPRLQQGFNVLLQHTNEGLNAMPPRGGCFECTDEQLILAILSLLPEKEQTDQ